MVASRLSENPDFSVLLLEAGGKASKISDIPFYAGVLQLAESDWNYTSEPNSEFCLGMKNRVTFAISFFNQILILSFISFFLSVLNINSDE